MVHQNHPRKRQEVLEVVRLAKELVRLAKAVGRQEEEAVDRRDREDHGSLEERLHKEVDLTNHRWNHLILIGLWVSLTFLALSLMPTAEAHRILGQDGKPKPHWVRYPFEFQLCGISLGDKLLDRVEGNLIFRYALIRVHGIPDGLIIGKSAATAEQAPPSSGGPGGATGAGGGPGGGAAGGPAGGATGMGGAGPSGARGAGAAGPGAGGGATQQFQQQEGAEGPTLPAPAWALAAWVVLDGNHVEWLYKRDNYVMGFMVDHLGFIDGIVVSGSSCPIARTQMGDPTHCIKLGDDFRKVMYRYGFPDEIDTFTSSGGVPEAGAEAGLGGGLGSRVGLGGGGVQMPGSATVQFSGVTNSLMRSYLFKYHDSYNVIFTIQNNHVVRINVWGDPDYFTAQRKSQLRVEKY